MRPAVFLDRDDTLIACRSLPAPQPPAAAGDLVDPALVAPLPGALEACAALRRAGFALVVVTNQGVVARGGLTIEGLERIGDALRSAFTHPRLGTLLDAVYACPHHPAGRIARFAREHPWRKPAPGMLLAAADDLGLDLARSWMIGDAERDLAAARSAGIDPARALRVGDGERFASIAEAARHILASTDPP